MDFWNNLSAFSTAADYARVEYSTNGGTSWTQLANWAGPSAAAAWQVRNYALPVGGTVRIRFSGSVNATTEYADWDDIAVLGFTTTTSTALTHEYDRQARRRDVVLQPSHRRQRRELVGS